MKRYTTLTVTAAALAVAIPGCGSSDTSSSNAATTTRAAAATASTPSELLGQWTRFVTKADIARTQRKRSELGPNQETPKPETALMTFEPKALTTRNPKASFVVQHDYKASADGKLVILGYQHPETGSFCGPEVPQNASYSWKLNGDKLVLRAVSDQCADRDSTFSGSWTRR
jgi:hypothetical protein